MDAEPQAAAPEAPVLVPRGEARPAVVELLGTLAYAELSAFLRLAGDAEFAPTLSAKASLAGLAVVEFGHFEALCARLRELGAEPEAAMAPFVAPLDAFHERTTPTTWLESLVKYHVGDGIASDFYSEVSAYLDPATRDVVVKAMAEDGRAEFVVQEVRRGIAAEPVQAGRLALWGRRLVGEALSQAQWIAADREAFADLLVGTDDTPGAGLAGIVAMFERITERHTQRMTELGLNA